MCTTDPRTVPAQQEPHDLPFRDVGAPREMAAGPGASCGRPDKPIEPPGHTQHVASWSADARPTLTLQRQLIAGLVG
jgi:hypothetical protein